MTTEIGNTVTLENGEHSSVTVFFCPSWMPAVGERPGQNQPPEGTGRQ